MKFSLEVTVLFLSDNLWLFHHNEINSSNVLQLTLASRVHPLSWKSFMALLALSLIAFCVLAVIEVRTDLPVLTTTPK